MANSRGRPRITNLGIRFPDADDFWQMALGNSGAKKALINEKAAIHFQHQLNMYRKASRDMNPEGLSVLDNYIVRREEHRVIIMLRPRVDLSDATTLDGRPINTEYYIQHRDPLGQPIEPRRDMPTWTPRESDPNPFTQDKPLKLDDD